MRFGCVLADAGYGSSGPFRQALSERGLLWAVGLSRRQNVYPADIGLVFPVAAKGRRRQYHMPGDYPIFCARGRLSSSDDEPHTPKPKTPDEALAMAKEYFEERFPSAQKRFDIGKFAIQQAERLDPQLVDAWPREGKAERAMFEKLKEAYVKARYSKHYRISAEELDWLSTRIEALGAIVHSLCANRLTVLEAEINKNGAID